LASAVRNRPSHLCTLEAKEFRTGYFSESFKELFAGAVIGNRRGISFCLRISGGRS